MSGNLKRTPVTYRPFAGQAILADGLLAVERPGGEVEAAIAQSLFGVADTFRAKAERQAADRGERMAKEALAGNLPRVDVTGGEREREASPAATGGATPNRHVGGAGSGPQHFSGGVDDAIGQAAARHGVSHTALRRIAQIESGMDPKAKNPRSSAGGLFQFIDSTAAQYGLRDRYNPVEAADAAARLLRDNGAYLAKKLGRQPTAGELYLAHQQGAGGAARLLANPNMPAASIVGAEAVRLNGGRDGMTAGEFASLWTRKAGNSSADTFVAGPTRRTPLSVAVTGDGLKLTGRDTIYGRAYDKAATATYKAALEGEMLDAAFQIFDRYSDDPTEMAAAFGQLRQAQLAEHVPPEIRADFEIAFSQVERGYLRKAQKVHDAKIDAEDRAAFDAEGERLAEAVTRAEAGLAADTPESLDVMAAEAARLKDHWREAVRRGYATPEQAAKNAAAMDAGIAVRWHLNQAEGLDPAGIAAMRKELQEDYAAGRLPQVNGAAWEQIDDGLKRLEREGEIKRGKAAKDVADQAGSILDRAADGYEIPPAEMEALRTAASGLEDGAEIMDGVDRLMEIGTLLRQGPVAEAEKKLRTLKDSIGTAPTARQVALIRQGEAMVRKAREEQASDPLGFGFRAGVIADPGEVADAMQAGDLPGFVARRITAAEDVARRFNVAPRVFRPGEAAALEGMVRGNAEQGAAVAGALVKGAGTRAADMLREFGQAAPVLAAAGAIVAGGGDVRAAQDAIAGSGKTPDGRAYSTKGSAARRERADQATRTAFAFHPADARRVTQAAEWIARKRMDDAGIEHDAPEAEEIFSRALSEAAGGIFDGDVQWGGLAGFDPGFWASEHMVVVPNTIRANQFDEVIAAVRDEDLKVKPAGGVAQLAGLWPVPTRGGYVFVNFDEEGGSAPLEDENGKLFVLDIEAMAPVLGPRVPGAIRGY